MLDLINNERLEGTFVFVCVCVQRRLEIDVVVFVASCLLDVNSDLMYVLLLFWASLQNSILGSITAYYFFVDYNTTTERLLKKHWRMEKSSSKC